MFREFLVIPLQFAQSNYIGTVHPSNTVDPQSKASGLHQHWSVEPNPCTEIVAAAAAAVVVAGSNNRTAVAEPGTVVAEPSIAAGTVDAPP